ncbi:MAG: thioredoxin family protein [Polyangiales bacterium]
MTRPAVVSREVWLEARKALLEKEKELTHKRDELAELRRALPWVQTDKPYTFEGEQGERTLSALFEGRSQLVVYHFMLGPGWREGCPSCSMLADHLDGALAHLAARDVSLVVISRAPYAEIAAFKARMGWRFPWFSSYRTDFNQDYHVSFTPEQAASGDAYYNFGANGFPSEEGPGVSVFAKDAAGDVFHTYSTYARGAEPIIGAYTFLDMVPKGRDEASLPWPMAWVRLHDAYGKRTA